ncbi:MAG: helix-turn-helix domain-containing protein [Sphingobacterium sp.]|jgi:transcriptional regulator with XRE-family HTH domain|nr:helix-turn-helix domain-containing protein [Sphingobacterium sp.]
MDAELFQREIIDSLKSIRIKKGYSQLYISEKLNISQSNYNKIENHQVSVKLLLLLKILDCLNISFQQLITKEDSEGSLNVTTGSNNNDREEILLGIIKELNEQIRLLRESRKRRGERITQLKEDLKKVKI